jgi:hypothetical protein
MEHWFLSADFFPTASTEFKTGDDGVTLKSKPASFYGALNFQLGDLQSQNRTFIGNFALKFLIEASKHPAHSLGFGVGLRGHALKRFGLDFDSLSPFAGLTFTKPDNATEGTKRHREFRFGVSLSLEKALDWIN